MDNVNSSIENSTTSKPLTARAWSICGLLLFASAINYMDRQTLANASVRITQQFNMNQEMYGDLEAGFGWSFAIGSLVFGFLSDRVSIRWLYPAVLFLWSGVGFATGYTTGYHNLLLLRILLGFFEAGHWPCGIKAVRRLLDARGRTLGNGLLQSGTSIGAIATPLAMRWLLTEQPGSWRIAFQVIGAIGLVWIGFWLAIVRKQDLAPEWHDTPCRDSENNSRRGASRHTLSNTQTVRAEPWWIVLSQRRMWVVLTVVALINTTWQLLRAWLPKFLQEGRGYSEESMLIYNAVWFASTDVGCLSVGAVVLMLSARGLSLNHARLVSFFACAALCLGTLLLPFLSQGPMLLLVLLIAGAGALGVFPLYHAFSQDISGAHQGKVTGIAGVAAWAFSPLAQKLFGRLVDETGSFDLGLAAVGCLPIVAGCVLWLFWGADAKKGSKS